MCHGFKGDKGKRGRRGQKGRSGSEGRPGAPGVMGEIGLPGLPVSLIVTIYSVIHIPWPCVFLPSRHNFRDIELKFCIFITSIQSVCHQILVATKL